jgi:hypothetical protein
MSMFSDRSSHYQPLNGFHSRGGLGGRSHGLGGLGGSGGRFDGMIFGGRSSLGGRHGSGRSGRIGFGREGGVRLDDTPMLRRRQGSMNELMDGLGELNLGGGRLRGDRLGGDRRSPLLGRSPLGSRDSLLFGGRSPLGDDLLGGLGGRHGPLLGRGMGMSGLGSRESLRSSRAELLGGGLLGRGSQPGSSRASSIFDLHALDRPRMPYGPFDASLDNYRHPYVEEYFSEIDPEELLMLQEMDRRGVLFWDEPHDDRLW